MRCSASSMRSRRQHPRHFSARRGRPRALRRSPGTDRAAVAPHLRGADALLQNRRRVPGLLTATSRISDGRRQQSARSLVHLAELFRLADAAGCRAIPTSPLRECARCSRWTASRELQTPTRRRLSINTATPRRQPPAARDYRARSQRVMVLRAHRRGGTRPRAVGLDGQRTAASAYAGLTVTRLCRGACSPRLEPPRSAARCDG